MKLATNKKNNSCFETFIYFIILFSIFFSPKSNFDLKIFYVDFSFLGYLAILVYVIFKKDNYIFLTNKIIFLILLFFMLHFIILSGIYDSRFHFLKQFFIFIILFQLFLNLAPIFNVKKFLNIYIKFSTFAVLSGYLIFIFSILNSFFYNLKNKNNYLENFSSDNILELFNIGISDNSFYKIFHEIFSLTNPIRFQGFVNEPATYSILIIPFLYICINNIKKNKIITLLTFFSVLLAKSAYGYLGLVIILFYISYDHFLIKKKNYVVIILVLFLSITSLYYSPDLRFKIINITTNLPSSINAGFNHNIYEKTLKEQYDKLYNYNPTTPPGALNKHIAIETHKLLNLQKAILNSKMYKITKDNKDNIDNKKIAELETYIKIKKGDKFKFKDFKYFSDKGYFSEINYVPSLHIGSTSCSYLSNLFIIMNDWKFLFTGTGLGSHQRKYNANINKWYNIRITDCLGLNGKDAKSIYLRLLSEVGLVFLIPFILFLLFSSSKNEHFKKTNIHRIVKIFFMIKCLQIGKYYDLSLIIFFLMLIKSTYFKKYALIETFYIKKCIRFYNKIIINKD